MSEEQIQDAVAEVVAPANQEQEQEVKEVVETPPQEDVQEKNWREMRASLRDMQRQNEMLQEEIRKSRQPPVKEEVDEIDQLADDEYLTKAQAKKLAMKLAEKAASEVIRKKEAESIPDKLRSKFQDFDEVVSKENVQLLIETEPELAQSLNALKHDPFAQGVTAYKLLKKQDFMQQKLVQQEKQKVAQNQKKPMASNAAGPSGSRALENAHRFSNGLTPQLKDELLKEMMECSKRG